MDNLYDGKELLIGSHVSMSGPKYFLGSIQETLNNNGNTLMFYTGSPQTTVRSSLEKCKIDEAIALIKENNINLDTVVCHAPYLINLGNEIGSDKFEFSKKLLLEEVNRCHAFHSKLLVLHPGAHLGIGIEKAIKNIAYGINEVLNSINFNIIICLETMAGKGTEVGSKLEEIKEIIDLIDKKECIGVCIDTCHLNDTGFDMSNFDAFLEIFDKVIGLDFLKVVHLNDSLNPRNSHKDRHANLGLGTIGYENLKNIAYNNKLKEVPKILETPFYKSKSPYKLEIEMLRNKNYNSNRFEDL